MKKKVFISHSKNDKMIADLVCSALESNEVGCWIAPRDIPYGNDWAGEITNAIEQCELFVFILSQSSNASRQCPKEISIADNVGVPIICIKIDDLDMKPGIKYHLSMHQMMVIDAAQINEKINTVVASVKNKLFGTNERQTDKENVQGSENTKNLDEILSAHYDKRFESRDVDEVESITKENTSVTTKLQDIAAKKFIRHFEDDANEIIEQKKDHADMDTTWPLSKLVLSPLDEEGRYIGKGKHFSLPHTDGVKTLVFQIHKVVDYNTMSRAYDCTLLESIEDSNDGYTTYFVDSFTADVQQLFFLHIGKEKAYVNVGVLENDALKVSKKPAFLKIQKIAVNDDKLNLSTVGYDTDLLSLSDSSDLHGNDDEVWHEADVRLAPTVIIDLEKAELVRREVYYDQTTATMKARIKLHKNKSYFTFQIRNGSSSSDPLTKLEQAHYFRLGLYGFPKDPLKAAEILENENTPEAQLEMALLLGENDEFYDEETYCQYLQEAIRQHSKDAVVEQALAVYFEEVSNISLHECIEMLESIVTDESTVSAYVLAAMLEEIDPKRSYELYLSSAHNDFPPAISRLQCLDSSMVSQYEDTVSDAFMNSLKDNAGLKEYCLGCATFYGYGMRVRKAAGLELLVKAAELGDIDAQRTLFEIYDTDEQCEDKQKALFWLEKVVAFDQSEIVTLADRYIDGIGCDVSQENDEKAFLALSMLEDSDDYVAINNLAWMLRHGRGCEQDYQRAKLLLERAAENGHTASIYQLGIMYEEGLGVGVDIERAIDLYTEASEKGSKKAKERLETIKTNKK